MNQRFLLTALGIGALISSSSLIGCGDFSGTDEPVEGSGGDAAGSGGDAAGSGGDVAGSGGDVAGSGGDVAGSGGTMEPPEPSCENVVPCGGDVTGNWFAVDSCLSTSGIANLRALGIGCEEGTAAGTLEVGGNLTVGAAGEIVTDTTQTTGALQIGLGPDCKDVSGTVIGCADVAGPLKSLGFIDPTTCADSTTVTDGCDCTGTVNQASVPGFVTTDTSDVALYTAEGNVFSLQGNVTVDYDYCVEGEYMHVTPKTVSDAGTMTGTILFRKQP